VSSAPQVTNAITLRGVLRDLGILAVLLVVFDNLLKWHHSSILGDFAYWLLFFSIFCIVKWAVSLASSRNQSSKNQPDRDEALERVNRSSPEVKEK